MLRIPLLLFAEYSVNTPIAMATPAWAQHAAPLHYISRRSMVLLLVASASVLSGQSGELSRPTGVEASDGAYSDKVGICWDYARNATAYRIFRGATNDPASAVSVGTTASLIFYDPTAEVSQQYFYWVRAENGDAASALSQPDAGFRAQGRNSFGRIPPLEPPAAPPENPLTGAKIYLGKTLFWDEQVSSTRTVACGTCHRARNGGSDPRSVIGSPRATHPGFDGVYGTSDDVIGSPGVPMNRADGSYEWSAAFGLREQVTRRKSQPVIDSAYFDRLFWDGRATGELRDPLTGAVIIASGAALEAQSLDPPVSSAEMGHIGSDWSNVVARIAASRPLALSPSIPAPLAAWIGGRGYPELFAEAFGTPEVTAVRFAMAVASYQRTLYSDRTRFDADLSSITEPGASEQRGRELFTDKLCDQCHERNLLSDKLHRFIGLRPDGEDEGRAEVTGLDRDRGRFRTPSLRNVALRSPYMHDGRFATLEEVVEFYDRGGDFEGRNKDIFFIKPLQLSGQDKADLVAFMSNQLTDERVAAGAGPLFDRPMLYSESARVPQIEGSGTAGSGGFVPQVVAIEPPLLGNPSFTVGLYDALGGAAAVLVIDDADPGAGPATPESTSFARATVTAKGSGPGKGYASLSLPIPNDPALAGKTLVGRWFVMDAGAAGGVAVTPAFRMTVFGPAGPAASSLSSLSAASLALGFVAPESLVSAFGEGLAAVTETASMRPLPTALAEISVVVRDSTGRERLAPLFYASARQINYQVPPGTAEGEAAVQVVRGGASIAAGTAQVAAVAPALFSANASGRGIAAALAVRVHADGSQTYEQVARFDPLRDEFVAEPVDLGAAGDQVFLVLFGTGIRLRNASGAVTATVGGEPAEVLYAGAQPEYVGVDQINLRLNRDLAGRGDVDVGVVVDGRTANTVRVNVR
jgi:cytochrome c peroxidase